MQVQVAWSHGIAAFLKERCMDVSDNFRLFVCSDCKRPATACNPERGVYLCKLCKNNTRFKEVRVPYSLKLLLQEVACLGVGTRLLVE